MDLVRLHVVIPWVGISRISLYTRLFGNFEGGRASRVQWQSVIVLALQEVEASAVGVVRLRRVVETFSLSVSAYFKRCPKNLTDVVPI